MIRLLPLLFFLSSCALAPQNLRISQSTDLEKRSIKRIAILPVDSLLPKQAAKIPYSVAPSEEGAGAEREAGAVLTQLLYSAMTALPHWQMVSEREVREVDALVPLQGEIRARAKKLGETVYADVVLFGTIQRFREREGAEFGVKSPASVAFTLHLLDVKKGDIVWSAHFEETQRPLSENIFAIGEFAQRGAKWLKAEELAHEGIKKAVAQLHKTLYGSAT
jgi:hypothetical protein